MGRATRWLRSLLGSKKESRDGAVIAADDRREKRRWSFKSVRDSFDSPASVPAAKPMIGAPWLHVESENEQNKHAIAVAAATAAAADAAITAAQAAVAVVQLTSNSRRTKFSRVHEYVAAVMIQRIFRGYLAKKALRALKSLVKLQALARGYLVRKQAAATLHSMQALIRAQAIVRAQKSRAFLSSYQEMFDEIRSGRSNPFHRRSTENQSSNFDRSPKIVQIDSCRPRPSRRTGCSLIDRPYDEISPNSVSSPLRGLCLQRTPPHDCRPSFNGHEWSSPVDKCRCCSTTQTTPRCINPGAVGFAPPTPAKSVFGSGDGELWRFQNSGNCPNYMISTRSFEAKVRSKSAPKQRMGSRQRVPLSEMVVEQARASLSGAVGMHRPQEPFYLRSAATRHDSSLEVSMEAEGELHLQKQNW